MKFTSLFIFMSIMGCEDKSSQDTEETGIDEIEKEDTESEDSEVEETDTEEDDDLVNADYTVDASDSTVWVYFDLDTKTEVYMEDPIGSVNWDLKFQRYDIGVNGGVSGNGSVSVLVEPDMYSSYEDIQTSPEGEWITDKEDADGDDKPEYAFKDWFDYDLSTHVLTPADVVYFIRSTVGDIYKFRVISYYSEDGVSGFPSIEFDLLLNEEGE